MSLHFLQPIGTYYIILYKILYIKIALRKAIKFLIFLDFISIFH